MVEFNYNYRGSSSVRGDAQGTRMSFSPDTLRPPTYFQGSLRQSLPFREAISALHDVVVSDLRFIPKDRTAYKEWLSQQELLDMAQVMQQRTATVAQMQRVRGELDRLQAELRHRRRDYDRAVQRYFDYIYTRDYDAWLVLDPVITIHPDEIFFECFSKDESSYGRLSVNYDVFEDIGEFACGTTNIDYSSRLYDEFQKIRTYKTTRFEVDPGGFTAQTGQDEAWKEVKIDLPDSWVRGFLQVNAAMALPMVSFDLDPMDIHNICFVLRRKREIRGPRAMRYVLKPGEPVRILFEPWGDEVVCARSIYKGPQEEEIRVWGRRRVHILERLIPVARKFTVHLLGKGMPSFYVADLGPMSFTLGLSGWTANDWSRAGNFDLMAPRKRVDQLTMNTVYDGLKENWRDTPDALAARLGLDRATVLGALGVWTQAGRAIFDLNKKVYRARELSREPLPLDTLRFSNPREEKAWGLLGGGGVRVNRVDTNHEGALTLSGTVREGRHTYQPSLTIDADERMLSAECSCYWHGQNKLRKGPCEHILALRAANERQRRQSSGRVW
jgi:hypothetical protein